MKRRESLVAACAFAMLFGGLTSPSFAAKKDKNNQAAPIAEAARPLEAKYASMLADLKSEIQKALPQVNDQKKNRFLQAHAAEMVATAKVENAKGDFGDINKAAGLVQHGHWWVKDAAQQIAKAQQKLKTAATDSERAALQKTIEEQTKRKQEGEKALKEREAALANAKSGQENLNKSLKIAQDELAKAKLVTKAALAELNPKSFLANDALDQKLIKFEILSAATPRGLAEFASNGPEQEAAIESLLNNPTLMREMVLNDGPAEGKYGQAAQIYAAIQKASPKAADGVLQRLAMAVSLEHAVPVKQTNPKDQANAPENVDPVNRYLAYEKAYLANDLDPSFKKLTTWDLRFVVDGDEPDEIMAWGRQMLRNYRPDIVANNDYRWRYVQSVPTEVQYGSKDQVNDLPSLQPYQNMIANGGVCGRRAFFGRFILRAFGIPTTARPQSGHAALVHWTPAGWVANLGGGWGAGWTKTIYGDDVDFLAVAQGRQVPKEYIEVQRAQILGSVAGEARAYGFGGKKAAKGFWNIVAIARRSEIITDSKAEALGAVGEELGESNDTTKEKPDEVKMSDADRKITVSADGVITIPAVASSKPTNSTGRLRFMPSSLGGFQLHYTRGGKGEPFEYTFDAPAGGKYKLTARVVTTSDKQSLMVAVNDQATPTTIDMPYTIGMWELSSGTDVELARGKNVLHFSRPEGVKGLTIKDFTLTPVK